MMEAMVVSARFMNYVNYIKSSKLQIFRRTLAVSFKRPASSSEVSDVPETRKQLSALYVSGRGAQSQFSLLTPYMDFTKTLQNVSDVMYNAKQRGLSLDVQDIAKQLSDLQSLKSKKSQVEEERTSITKIVKKLSKKNPHEKEEYLKYRSINKDVKQQLKVLNNKIWDLEETAVVAALQLPNYLHKATGYRDKVLFNLFGKPEFSFAHKSHIELGKFSGDLEFIDNSPTSFYLKNKLAVLELACGDYFTSGFRAHGYISHSFPNFAKSIVVEGTGADFNNREKIFQLLNQSALHLVGGGSLQAFAAYLTRQLIEKLPLKLITQGRNYTAEHSKHPGLFGCVQSNVVDAAIVFEKNPQVEEQMLNEILMALIQCYTKLKIHFRVTQYGACHIEPHECAAMGILMFSPSTGMYHEVCRISLCDDYISKRLWILHKSRPPHVSFASIIHVRICHISRLLALLIENGQKEDGTYDIPEVLMPMMFGM